MDGCEALIMSVLSDRTILFGVRITGFRDSSPNSELFLNIYRVLLTRIKNRIFIWFSDKKTEEYFKEICIDKPDLQTNPPVGLLPDRGITA